MWVTALVPMCAGHFLYIQGLRVPRGAISGEQQRERGAVEPTMVLERFSQAAWVQQSGGCCARAFDLGETPPAERASCVLRCARSCAGDVT